MDTIVDFVALCRQGLHEISALPAGLPLTLFAAGVAGSLVHCVGMCGPFVLAQVVSDADGARGRGYGEWQRLAGAALLPYHLGRLTTYSALGAIAGGATALFTATTGFAWLSAVLLALAAGLMLLQALGLTLGAHAPFAATVSRLAAPLSRARGPLARYAFGVVLGLLPCGLLYGALAAAAGTGAPAEAALAMAGFALGTMPALVAAGFLGVIVRRRLRGLAVWLATPLLVGNALVMLALAAQRLTVG